MTRFHDNDGVEASVIPEPDSHTTREALRYGMSNGSRKLLVVFGVSMVAMAVLIVLLFAGVVRTVTEPEFVNPYEIRVPGVVAEVNDDGHPVAQGGRVRLITERCNTTDEPVVLDISTTWLHTSENNLVIPGSPLSGVTVVPGGSFCDPPTSDPIVSGIELPAAVEAEGGVWQYQSQIVVSACNEWSEDPDTPRVVCDEVGPVLDQVGWFSEQFIVTGSGHGEGG